MASHTMETGAPEALRSRAYRWYVLVLLAVAYAVHAMDRTIIYLLVEPIKAEFGLSDSALGLLTGLGYAVPFAIAGLPLGALADRVSRKKLLAILVAVWSVFTAFGGVARGFASLLATRMAVGAAESGTPSTALSLVSDFFPPKVRASAVSVFYVGAPLGAVLGAHFGGMVTAAHGWRMTLFVAAVPGLVVALIIWLTVREPRRGASEAGAALDSSPSPPFKDVFALIGREPGLALIIAALVLSSMSTVGISSWTPAVLMRGYGVPVAEAGAFMALTGLVGMGGTLLGGVLSDVMGRGKNLGLLLLAGLANVTQGPSLIMSFFANDFEGFKIPFLVWTVLHTIYYGAGFGLALSLAPVQMRARLMAITFVLCNILGAGLGPQIIGGLSDLFAAGGDPQALPRAVAWLGVAATLAGVAFLAAIRFVPKVTGALPGHR